MKTILIKEGCPNPISLGEKGENGVSAVLFDYSEWLNDFGNGAISLLVKRKGDTAAYPVVLTTADGIATWTISDTDTAVQGYGKAEYVFTIDDKVAKSAVFSFYVAADLGPSGDPPDPYESWIDTLTALGGETLINAQRAEAAESGAEAAQTAAETAATNAATSATNAAQSAGAARDMAASALSSADRATASATAASGHATAAEAAKDLAISAAESAQHSETQAELSASAAAESAESASGSAAQAQQSASNASQSATQAASSATNAASSATSASGSASAAATSAEQAAESAEQANIDLLKLLPVDTASGSIASFSDGADDVPVEALSVALEPVQDLNGQASPYPAGGGKNILAPTFYNGIGYNVAVGAVLTLTEATDVSVSGNTYTRTVGDWGGFGMCSPQLATGTYYLMAELASVNMRSSIYALNSDMSVSRNLGNYGSGTTRSIGMVITLSGDEAYIAFNCLTSSAGNVSISTPMVALSSSATSFAPYSNICPITGHTQAQVWRAGVNVWDEEWEVGGINADTGIDVSDSTRIRSKNYIRVEPSESYYTTGRISWFEYDENHQFLFRGNGGAYIENAAFTVGAGTKYIRFIVSSNYGTTYNNDISINYPSTDTAYHAHSIVHISIPLGQTVYGGSIDVVEGVLTVDRAIDTITKDGAWYGFATGTGNSSAVIQLAEYQNVLYVDGSSSHNGAISSTGSEEANYWVNARQNEMPTAGDMCFAYSATGQLRFHRLDVATITDIASFKANFPDTQVCYKLATPITIDLTDIPELTTLYGTNNIWSDSGDVDVTYRADIQKYITKVISEALS